MQIRLLPFLWAQLALTLSSIPQQASVDACTVFVAGKDATIDGSTFVSHSNDGEFDTDPRLVKIPNMTYPEGAQRPIFFSPESYPRYVGFERGPIPEYYPKPNEDLTNQTSFEPIGFIPQVTNTYAYMEDTYGAVNEMQVAVGENTCSGVFGAIPLGAPNGTALFSIDQLTQIAMERAATARQAITIMGELAERYGFYGAGQFEGTGESLGVTDPKEAWIFHILPDPTGKSAIWAAQRLPDDEFAAMANMFVLRQLDPDDKDNFLMSSSVHTVAREYGWWDPSKDGLLDFTKMYSDGEYAQKYYSGRRVWGAYLLAGLEFPDEYKDLQSDPVYPISAKPKELISVQDLFKMHRFTYQGTKYDLGAEGLMAAGPFGSPDRWKAGPGEKQVGGNWERAIGLYRTSDTYVVQSRADASTGSVLWFGPASSLGTVFTPFIVSLSDIPPSFRSGHHAKFSRGSAFWAACYAQNIANLKYNYAIKDIQKRQNELEGGSVELVQKLEEQYSKDHNFESVEKAYMDNIDKIVTSLWSLSDEILFKYASGFVNDPTHGGMSQMVGYPSWWLEGVDYQNGPPPPPTVPKCCDPPKLGSSEGGSINGSGVSNQLTGKVAMKHHQYLRSINGTHV